MPRKSADTRIKVEMATEVWLPIPPLPFYEASSLGRIRSLDRSRPMMSRWGKICMRPHRGRVLRLKPKPNGWGGTYFCFYTDGDVYWQVNRAVCWAFHGAPPSPQHEAAHLDGRSLNDLPSNLIWATPAQNAAHKIIHGTSSRGMQNGQARLTEDDVQVIIREYAGGARSDLLAERYGVSKSTILQIVGGKIWVHVPSECRLAAQAQAKVNMFEAPRCVK